MMEALRLKNVDEDFAAHRQAWLNREVQAEKQVGKQLKPVFGTFDQFFDYEKRLNNNFRKIETIRQIDTLESRISKIYQKRKGGK